MSEPARIYAFAACFAQVAPDGAAAAGTRIAARRPHCMLALRGRAGDAAKVRAFAGLELPREPNTVADAGTIRALWLGPEEWLLVCERTAAELPAVPDGLTVTDVSHGRAALRLSGPQARNALAKACALDLHPHAFPVQRCAQTLIAKIPVLLDHVHADAFDLYCPRSYAGSFWHWLIEACEEYGYELVSSA